MDLAGLQDRLDLLHSASPAERRALREALLDQLQAPEMPMRALAASGLGRVGDERVVAMLVRALHDPAPLVQWRAAYALRALHTRALVAPERLVFLDGPAFEKWKRALLARLTAALDTPDEAARLDAAYSLQEIGVPETLPALVAAALDSADPVCWQIGQAIKTIVQEDAERLAVIHPHLIPALHNGDPWIRQVAVGLSALVGDRGALPDLLTLLHDPDRAVRRTVCAVLGDLGDSAAAPALIGRLADDEPAIRAAAAMALGQIGDPYAVPALIQIARDEDSAVRSAVFTALGQIGVPAAQPALLRGLQDGDAGVRLAAMQALARVGDQQALKPLSARARDRAEVDGRRLGQEASAAGKAIRARLRAAG